MSSLTPSRDDLARLPLRRLQRAMLRALAERDGRWSPDADWVLRTRGESVTVCRSLTARGLMEATGSETFRLTRQGALTAIGLLPRAKDWGEQDRTEQLRRLGRQ